MSFLKDTLKENIHRIHLLIDKADCRFKKKETKNKLFESSNITQKKTYTTGMYYLTCVSDFNDANRYLLDTRAMKMDLTT